ncbi:MAG: glycosyltransferase family 39 protein [Ignavibacteria bacterium]|jgi:hypothetical protein
MKIVIEKLKKYQREILVVLFVIALILRIVAYNLFIDSYGTDFGDSAEYQDMGYQIAEGNWNPRLGDGPMVVAPGIPLIVAASKLLFGDGIFPTVILNIILTSLAVFVLYYIGSWLFNWQVGLLLALWVAVYYEAIKFSMFTHKEAVIFFIFPFTILFLLKSLDKEFSLKYIFLSALSFNLLIHVDERFVVYLLIFPLVYFINHNSLKIINKTKPCFAWVTLVLLMMIPWTIRNYYVFDQVVILSPRTTVFTAKIWGKVLDDAHFTGELSKDKIRDYVIRKAEKYEKEYGLHPRIFGKTEARIKAFFNYWQPTYFDPHLTTTGYRIVHWSTRMNIASIFYYGIYLPFYIIGILLLIRRKHYIALFLAAIPVLHSLLHAYMIWTVWRYRSPMDFIVAMIGIWTIIEIYKFVKKKITLTKQTV